MRHGWIGVLALAVVPAVCASALRGAAVYSVTQLVGPEGSAVNVAQGISSAGVVGISTINNIDYGTVWQDSQATLLPVPSGYQGVPLGINASGDVVGSSGPAGSSSSQPVLWHNGQMQTLSTPSGFGGEAFGINDSGVIVGQIINSQNTTSEAAMWSGGQMTVLGNFPNQAAYATSINNNGQVTIAVGPNSYIWSNGSLTAISTLAGVALQAQSINNNGTVVGVASITSGTAPDPGFVYKNGVTQLLPTFGADTATNVKAVNDFDVIVGAGGGDDGSAHALIWENGQVANLNDLIPAGSGWALQSATGIDNNGDIVGYGMFDNQLQAFELTPLSSPSGSTSVPEPASAATLGLAGLLLLRRRRRA